MENAEDYSFRWQDLKGRVKAEKQVNLVPFIQAVLRHTAYIIENVLTSGTLLPAIQKYFPLKRFMPQSELSLELKQKISANPDLRLC